MTFNQKPVIIPEKVSIQTNKNYLIVKGPKGELKQQLIPEVNIDIKKNQAIVSSKQKNIWGLYRGLILSMIAGVTQGYEKKLEIVGVGYKAQTQEKKLILDLGYSHSIEMQIPQDIDIKVEKNIITVRGINKQKVGQIAADIKHKRKPEPYKGKGVRYLGEEIKLKPGKKAIGESEGA